jgi:hypothetical protein
MSDSILRKFRWFWAWDDEREEAWLREMSQQGWHLQKVALPGFYTFAKGEPRDYVYRLDYTRTLKKNADYFSLFRDSGWEYLGEMNEWQYFRKEALGGEAPEIYTDNESKVQKYRRLMGFLLIFLPIILINIINMSRIESKTASASMWVNIVLLGVYVFGMIKLYLRVEALKRL